MQINRVNQQNQQTNFKAVYAKVNGRWHNLRSQLVLSQDVVNAVYEKAKSKRKFELTNKNGISWKLGGRFSKGMVHTVSVILTGKDAVDYEILIPKNRRENYFSQILQHYVECSKRSIVINPQGTEVISEFIAEA